jgi:hypothetical protein
MDPKELRAAVSKLLDEAERELGIVRSPGASDGERMRDLVASGQPLSPDLYRLTYHPEEMQ